MHYKLLSDLDCDPHINLQERGLHYGDGLFETMLLGGGQIKYWHEHYQRLQASSQKLFIDCPPRAWFEKKLEPYIELNQRLVIKIILTRGQGGRGIQIPEELESHIYILKYRSSSPARPEPVKAIFSEVPLAINFNLAGIKHLNRLDYVLAAHQLKQRPAYNEALLLNTSGFLVESIVNNLFFVKGNVTYTPLLNESGVLGIMRQLILKKLKQSAKKVIIGSFVKQELLESDECFLCNSVQGVRPITQIEDQSFRVGPLTKYLQQEFHGHSGS